MLTRHAVIFTLLLASLTSLPAASVQQNYLSIYLEINSARQQEKAEDYLGALVRYEVAETYLAKIHKTSPDWETELVNRWLKDCQDKVKSLTPLAARQLVGLNNEWTPNAAAQEASAGGTAMDRAQAQVTYPQVMLFNHPELAKAGFDDQIRQGQKVVDDLESAELKQSVAAKGSETVQ